MLHSVRATTETPSRCPRTGNFELTMHTPSTEAPAEMSHRSYRGRTPPAIKSFVLTAFDVTAGVTHWGMYNISATTTELPANAGVAGSSYGRQVVNVFSDLSYDGPCPPPGVKPFAHRYIFTVYALDSDLPVPASENFPPTALGLYRTLVGAGRDGHILASATVSGLYSNTPPSQ